MEINYKNYYNSYVDYNNILSNEKSNLKEISLQFSNNYNNQEFLEENVDLGKLILDGVKDTLYDPNSSIELIQGYKQILLELSVFNNNPKKTTHDKNQLMIKLGEILSNLENNNSNINLNPIVPNVVVNNSSTNLPQVLPNLETNNNNSSTNLRQILPNLEKKNNNSRSLNNSKRDPSAEERRKLCLDAVLRRKNENSFKSKKSTLNSNNNNSQNSLSTSSNSNNLPKISVESNKRNQLSDSSLNCNELINEIINNNCNEEENGNLINEIYDNLEMNKSDNNNNQSNNLSSLFEKLEIINNSGQGDCLFKSFETHLDIDHKTLRQQSVDWVYKNWNNPFVLCTDNILNSSTLKPIESREEYRNIMSVSGNWGDELSIEALSKFHNITVKVIYHNDNGNLDLFPVFNPGCTREYYLYFQKEHHYQAAILK
jgi:hypothetical protein